MNGKASEHEHQKNKRERATHLIHMDIAGPFEIPLTWEERRDVCQKEQNDHRDTEPQ